MRKGWEYKRFDEVFDLQMGKTPDRKNPEYFGGNNVWVSIRDLGDKEIADSNEHITNLAVCDTKIRKVKRGTVIMSFKLTVGKCGIAATDLYTNEAIMAFNPKESFDINSSFLYYYLQCYHWVGSNKAVMGITLNKATISKQYISLPPKSTQLAIVSELDKINELIRLKKEQLKDFDNLAQSLFYEMFGDPVENEKGWEVHLLKTLCTKIGSGATPKGGSKSYKKEGTSLIRSLNIHNNEFKFKDLAYIDDDQADSLNNVIVQENDVLLNITDASVARCCIVPTEVLPARVNQHVCILRHGNLIDAKYLNRLLTNGNYQQLLQRLAKSKAATREALPKSIVDKLSIPLPPLSLQRLFAQRIEQIEREKSEVQKSIQDLETLLASRMQYWFE